MPQAVYQPENIGHFGLALPEYAHFTSPIRRYPDLMVHRGIRHILRGGTAESFPWSPAAVAALGQQCSFKERRADEATRDALSWLKCEYMSDKLGEEFDALVTSVVDFGLFVQVKGVQVDGLVHVSALGADYFSRDSSGFRMVGARSGRVFRLGDHLRVRLINVIIDERKIDFELAEQRRRARDPRAVATAQRPSMSETTVVFGLHSVRALLQQRPERASLLVLQKGREDARSAELAAAGASGGRKDGMARRPRAGSARGQRASSGRVPADSRASVRWAKARWMSCSIARPHRRCSSCWMACRIRTTSAPVCARADAAGANAVIVPRDRAAGLTPTVRKVASGAAETLPLIQVVNLARTLRWLKEREIWVVGADDQAPKSVFEAKLTGPLALVLGAEGAGLRRLTRENCDLLVGIPMAGTVESLNVSVAAGVLLFEAARQRQRQAARPTRSWVRL